MAIHRKPTTDNPPPVELHEFKPEDWPGSPAERTWLPAYYRWLKARRTWEADTPGWLGRIVERMRDEHRARHQWMQRHPLADENGNWLIESEFIDPEFR